MITGRPAQGNTPTRSIKWAAWMLLVLSLPWHLAVASEPPGFVPEYCGQAGEPALDEHFVWECSGIEANSIVALEASLAAEYDRVYLRDGMSIHESKDSEPPSAWIFWSDRAVRYRAVFHEERWQGIAITTFCTGTDSSAPCALFGAVVARNMPMRLFFRLGPPPPVEPTIYYD